MTVAFKVKVNTETDNVVIKNIATVDNGTNKISSNEVSNTVPQKPIVELPLTPASVPENEEVLSETPENEAQDKAEKDNAEKSLSPQTGDDFTLWLALLFVTSGSIFGSTLLGKKKRETE